MSDAFKGSGETVTVIDIGQIVSILWRGKWIIAFCALALGVLAAAVSLSLPNRYTSDLRILIDPQPSQLVGIRQVDARVPINEALVESKAYMVRSNRVLEGVVDRLGLDRDPQFVGAELGTYEPVIMRRLAMRELNQSMVIRTAGTSFVINVEVTTYDPGLSAKVANAVGRVFVDLEREAKLSTAREANDWLITRLNDLQEKVSSSSQALESFRAINGVSMERRISELSRDIERQRLRLGSSSANSAEKTTIEKRISDGEEVLRDLTQKMVQLNELERQAQADQVLYERFLERAKELEELETFQVADARLISDALSPLERSSPNRRLFAILGAILGGALGAGIVAVQEIVRVTKSNRQAA